MFNVEITLCFWNLWRGGERMQQQGFAWLREGVKSGKI